MIITRTPLRVSLLGGGTDLPSFYKKSPGTVLSFALKKYIYISLSQQAESKDIVLKYSKLERVQSPEFIQHPIVREAFLNYRLAGVDLSVSSEIPAGTGLGSSSSFTVGLIKAISLFSGENLTKVDLASRACNLEIEILEEPIGRQDQFAASFGGLNQFIFNQDSSVEIRSPRNQDELKAGIGSRCLLVRTGTTRSASMILEQLQRDQDSNSLYQKLSEMASLAFSFCNQSVSTLETLAEYINASWEIKKSLSPEISNQKVETLIQKAKANGAIGAKLLGAGGSGYLFLIFNNHFDRDNFAISNCDNLISIVPEIDLEGCSVIYNSEEK